MSVTCTGFENTLGRSRRSLLQGFGLGLGSIALTDLLARDSVAGLSGGNSRPSGNPTPRAKRVIFLFQSGGPSQLDLFDFKPRLKAEHGKELPESIRQDSV